MRQHHHEPRARQERRVGVDVVIDRVRDVVAVGLEILDGRHGAIEEVAALAGRLERTIERDFVAVTGGQRVARVEIEALAAPAVVGLVGVRGHDDEHVDGAAIAHHERREARAAVGERDAREVDAARPVGAERHGEGLGPATFDEAGRGIERRPRLRRGRRRAFGELAPAGALVVAEAIDLPGRVGRRRRRDVDVERLAGEERLLPYVEQEPGIAGGEVGVPAAVAGLLVLVPHEIRRARQRRQRRRHATAGAVAAVDGAAEVGHGAARAATGERHGQADDVQPGHAGVVSTEPGRAGTPESLSVCRSRASALCAGPGCRPRARAACGCRRAAPCPSPDSRCTS